MADKWTIKHEDEEWTITTDGKYVTIAHFRGVFGLPVSQTRIFGGCADTVAKSIKAAASLTKPPKRAAQRRGNSL